MFFLIYPCYQSSNFIFKFAIKLLFSVWTFGDTGNSDIATCVVFPFSRAFINIFPFMFYIPSPKILF